MRADLPNPRSRGNIPSNCAESIVTIQQIGYMGCNGCDVRIEPAGSRLAALHWLLTAIRVRANCCRF